MKAGYLPERLGRSYATDYATEKGIGIPFKPIAAMEDWQRGFRRGLTISGLYALKAFLEVATRKQKQRVGAEMRRTFARMKGGTS